jgi:glycosyltransferase involved in cell wall biosynthesis
VVHDGCPIAEREVQPKRNRGPRIGLIGRITPWKGQHIFLQAAALLHPLYPAAKFEIIGAALFSESEYEAHLHELCRTLHLIDTVEFVGFVEDARARMAQLDIVVHASTIGEPFGQVIIEAMAEEKPVVATNGGGVPEIVEDGINGLLVPMNDASRMAQALGVVAGSSGRRRSHGPPREGTRARSIHHSTDGAHGGIGLPRGSPGTGDRTQPARPGPNQRRDIVEWHTGYRSVPERSK